MLDRWGVIGIGSASAVVGAALAYIIVVTSRPTSFDECVLDEMRGQPANMTQPAVRLCAERFPRPAEIRVQKEDWSWSNSSSGMMTVNFSEKLVHRYKLDKVLLKVSQLFCGIEDADKFDTYGPFSIRGSEATFKLVGYSAAACAHLVYVTATPK